MEKFEVLTARAAPLALMNIDTDMIIPKQFLKTIKRTGLGKNLFHEMRYDLHDKERDDFVLNKSAYKNAKILVTGSNFGCGSSREHAPWALLDFGIRSIIAPSFADIFFNNCFKNGILPIVLEQKLLDELLDYAKMPDNQFTIDLASQQIKANSKSYQFKIDDFKKHCLIEGLDDIGLTLAKEQKISEFEKRNRHDLPWLYESN